MTEDHRLTLGSVPRTLITLVVAAVLMSLVALPGASAQVPDDDDGDGFAGSIEFKDEDDPEDGLALSVRFAGDSRLETAGLIATDTTTARADFETSTLMVARADVFADALAGSFLGGLENSPLILSPKDTEVDEGELNSSVEATIAQNDPETITILGGVDAIDEDVEALLEETASVRRIGGVNRFETAALLADLAEETSTAIVANGGDFPDALVAGAIAAAEDFPILLTGSGGPLDPFAAERLEDLGIENVILAGGTEALDEDVEAQIEEIVDDVTRVGGDNRFETAIEFAEFAEENYDFAAESHTNLARADDFADALALGPHAGLDFVGPSPILLTAVDDLSEQTAGYFETLSSCDFTALHVAGGTFAVSDSAEDEARDILRPEGCEDDDIDDESVTALAGLFGVNDDDELLEFSNDDDGLEVVERTEIEGLNDDSDVVGADTRSSSGLFYVLGDDGELYTVDADGQATSRGNINDNVQDGTVVPPVPLPDLDDFDLEGDDDNGVGVDFNPTGPNALRIVLEDGTNLRVAFTPDGDVAATNVDGPLAYEAGDENEGEEPGVTAAGYTNNPAIGEGQTATATALYDIDTDLDILVTQNPANAGTLQTVGDLGVDADEVNGFEIVSEANDFDVDGNAAYASLIVDDESGIYEIDLETGEATFLADLDDDDLVALGFAPQNVPTSTVNVALSSEFEVVPPGAPDPAAEGVGATGNAVLSFYPDEGVICADIALDRGTDTSSFEAPAAGSHIHAGGAGEIGPIVYSLPRLPDMENAMGVSTARDCVAEGSDMMTTATAAEIEADPAAFYVNIHTQDYPAGVARGQNDNVN